MRSLLVRIMEWRSYIHCSNIKINNISSCSSITGARLYHCKQIYQNIFDTLKHFWSILGQRKTSLVIFLWRRRTSSVVFVATILFLMAYIRPLEIIVAKKTTELFLLFHKNITKLVFLFPNMGQKSFKVLNKL